MPNKPHLAGMDANMDRGSISLLSLNTLDVDDVLLPVDLHHFANLLAFVVSTDDLFVNNTSKSNHLPLQIPNGVFSTTPSYLDLVIFADGHGPHVVLLAELLWQRGRHDLPPDVWGGIEVPLAVLAAGGRYKWIQLHDATKANKTDYELDEPEARFNSEILFIMRLLPTRYVS